MKRSVGGGLRLVALVAAFGCSSLYYGALERAGIEKRHILADRIEEGRESQQEAQEQFQDAFERFKTATSFEGGELEDTYRALAAGLADSEARAEEVRDRITAIEQVAGDLFEEWETEIGQISRADLRKKSSAQLQQTRARYAKLLEVMKKAERKMEPVLGAFRDQVLFLKHNLNASAIASLETQAAGIQRDVDALVRDLSASIREADAFLATLEQGSA
jgi:uncharacterized phage infection (PIP) family protein YhgE